MLLYAFLHPPSPSNKFLKYLLPGHTNILCRSESSGLLFMKKQSKYESSMGAFYTGIVLEAAFLLFPFPGKEFEKLSSIFLLTDAIRIGSHWIITLVASPPLLCYHSNHKVRVVSTSRHLSRLRCCFPVSSAWMLPVVLSFIFLYENRACLAILFLGLSSYSIIQ